MAYTVPQFNLLCDIWNAGHVPSVDVPDAENVPCQFYLYSRGTFDVQPCELELYHPPIWIRLPASETANYVSGQVFECPVGSARYYRARFKERMHQGFPNEYLIVVVVQCGSDGIPILRDIEGAEPCGGPSPGVRDGDGTETLHMTIECEGEGEKTGGSGSFAGDGDILVRMDISCEGTGVQS